VDNIHDDHEVDGQTKAQQAVSNKLSSLIHPIFIYHRFLRIKDISKCFHSANNSTGKTANGSSNNESYLDIAVDPSIPPLLEIIPRPDECIEEINQVEDYKPED
jgi:hypothetical protein